MNSSVLSTAPSARPALELIALATLSPDVARRNLRALLAADPDHFGKLTAVAFKAVLNIEKDDSYESITGLGYNPASEWIQSIITLRQQRGYSETHRSPASVEYVRFYLSCNGGKSWQDQGMRACYALNSEDPRPRNFALTLRIRPRREPNLPQEFQRVRAILSWNTPPPANDPHWTPVWGDVAEAEIRLEASDSISTKTLPNQTAVDLCSRANATDGTQTTETIAAPMLSPHELRELYRGEEVPEHRYLSALLASMKAASNREDLRASDWEDLRTTSLFDGISDLDLVNLIPKWLDTIDDTSYEQLECVGFDSSSRHLVALINIKAAIGYGGGSSAAGTTEFVAFWIDCGERWKYVGTATVRVHDRNSVPASGLRYSACLPLRDSALVPRLAGGSSTFRVRAVLSWNSPLSTESTYQPVTWGNTLDALVTVPEIQAISKTSRTEAMPSFGEVTQ